MAKLLDAEQSKKWVSLALGPALWVLALDSWISHFAAKAGTHWSQDIPVYFGGLAGTALIVAALLSKPGALNATLIGSGALSALIGLAGTYYHVVSLIENMGEAAFTMEALLESLSVAPPPFAPAAFAGLGVGFLLIGMDRVSLALRLPGKPRPVDAATIRVSKVAVLEEVRKSAGMR